MRSARPAEHASRTVRPSSTPPPIQLARQLDRIKALGRAGAVLHLGAHPDDEDCGLISYLSRRHAARTVYWSATRGEGGQNRRGPERAEALGVVRTWESLEARKIDGGEVLYGPFYDFGFSKSGKDTLSRWGRDAVVAEVVRAIRTVQPLVVVCRWSGGLADGHGHHQAIGLVAEEAFDAAADADSFPELGIAPWRAEKLYYSVAGDWQPGEDGSFGTIVEEYEQAGYLRIDTGEIDVGAGLTYQEQAHIAVNQHRSQGIGFVPEPGPFYYYYRLARTVRPTTGPESDFFDDLDPTLAGLARNPAADWHVSGRLEAACQAADEAAQRFRPDRPSECVPALFQAMETLSAIVGDAVDSPLDAHAAAALVGYLSHRIAEFEDVITACMQVRVECLVDRARITPGRELPVTARIWSGTHTIDVDRVELHAPASWLASSGDNGGSPARPSASAPYEITYILTVPEEADPETPYWLREARGPYRYSWPESSPTLGQALDDPLVWLEAVVRTDGHTWKTRTAAIHRSGFPGGSRLLPLTVLPPLALAPRQQRVILPQAPRDSVLDLDVTVRCIEANGARAVLSLAVPAGWTADPPRQDVALAGVDDALTTRVRVIVPAQAPPGAYTLHFGLRVGGVPVPSS